MKSNRTLPVILALIASLVLSIFLPAGLAGAAAAVPQASPDAVVRAVLFYSPTCVHCHKVINEVLPPLAEKYGSQLDILMIDATQPSGNDLYKTAVQTFSIPNDRLGVPTLIVGDTVLVGEVEIPDQLPGIIEAGLAQGGIPWPDLPGLSEMIPTEIPQDVAAPAPIPTTDSSLAPVAVEMQPTPEPATEAPAATPNYLNRFRQDVVANSVAVVVLVAMIISVIATLLIYLRGSDVDPKRYKSPWPSWSIPVLSLIGLGVAAYLSYIEITHRQAVCGPVGNCNAVQQSQYATLWGFLPVGVFGMFGYVGILTAWLLYRYAPAGWRGFSALAIWGMAMLGVMFSIYLTFLEPFVIGATCAWCITSAVVITLILWASTPLAVVSSAEMAE